MRRLGGGRRAAGLSMLAVAAVLAAVVARETWRAGSPSPPPPVAPTAPSAPPAPAPPPPPAAPAVPVRPPERAVRVPVLMFHRVASEDTVTNAVSRDLTVTPEMFRREMDWLAANGFHPVTESALARAVHDGAALPPRPVVITFDDGYVDAVDAVAPVLRRHRWPATFFVITGRPGERAFLTWRQIVTLDREGMDIGSHGVDHADLTSLGEAALVAELSGSRRALAARLGHTVDWLAWPEGRCDPRTEEAARRAGYLLAYSTAPGSVITASGAMEEPRVRVHGPGSVEDFATAVTAASAPVPGT